MNYFLDTEFIESGPNQPIYLISVGLVAEDNRELYIEVEDAPLEKVNDWVKENVISNLVHKLPFDSEERRKWNAFIRDGGNGGLFKFEKVGREIIRFIDSDPTPTFYTYYGAYDWVVFCQIFGTMMDLPRGYERCAGCELPKDQFTNENHKLHSHANYYLCKEHDGYYGLEIVGKFPMFSHDLQSFLSLNNITNIEEIIPIENEHHALADARWNKKVYDWLQSINLI